MQVSSLAQKLGGSKNLKNTLKASGNESSRLRPVILINILFYNTIQLSFIPRPVYRYPVLESATCESLLLQQSTFVPQHSVDVVSYFHSVWGSAALLNAHPKNSRAQAEP